jgi:hypothetical protein
MATASFTPGPWNVLAANCVELTDYRSVYIEGGDPSDDINDMRLIAAAPDLYEALQRISDLKDEAYSIPEAVSPVVADIVARNAGRIARDALAKADGR